jgi:hypothetical protein
MHTSWQESTVKVQKQAGEAVQVKSRLKSAVDVFK